MEYTKGPWEFNQYGTVTDRFDIETEDKSHRNTYIAEVGGGLQSDLEIAQNARLIAAAPDMYEALLAAKHELELYIPAIDVKVLDQINAAIQKATL